MSGIKTINKLKLFLAKKLYSDAVPEYHGPSIMNQQRLPVVLLLGWGGSKRKSLKKVIEYYNDTGYEVISHTMPLLIPGFMRGYFEKLVIDEVNQHCPINNATTIANDGKELVCHVYSNNGSWVYASLLKKEAIRLPKLVIWDSAPFIWLNGHDINLESEALTKVAVGAIVRQQAVYHHPVYSPLVFPIMKLSLYIGRFIAKYQGWFHIIPRLHHLHVYLKESSPKVPSVFVYSTGDKVIPPYLVEEYLGHLKQQQIPYVTKVFGDDVSHTSAFYTYPEEYKEFIEKYLKGEGLKEDAPLETK